MATIIEPSKRVFPCSSVAGWLYCERRASHFRVRFTTRSVPRTKTTKKKTKKTRRTFQDEEEEEEEEEDSGWRNGRARNETVPPFLGACGKNWSPSARRSLLHSALLDEDSMMHARRVENANCLLRSIIAPVAEPRGGRDCLRTRPR